MRACVVSTRQRIERFARTAYQFPRSCLVRRLGDYPDDRLRTRRAHMHPAIRPRQPEPILDIYRRVLERTSERPIDGVQTRVRPSQLVLDDYVPREVPCNGGKGTSL